MYHRLNQIASSSFSFLIATVLLLLATSASAQIFKKKKANDGKERAGYAYQTYSTTQRKERRSGFAGDGAKFHFEKPLAPVPYQKIDRPVDYAKAPYFGHKRPPTKRSPGNMRLCKVCGIRH